MSEGRTEIGHMVTVNTLSILWCLPKTAPITPSFPIVTKVLPDQATGTRPVRGCNALWAVFLGIRPIGKLKLHLLGRETFLDPVTLTMDGWPIIGKRWGRGAQMDGPLPQPSIPAADLLAG
jgi:hypothetical protein